MPPHHLVSSQDWAANLPDHLTEIAELLIPDRTERTCPRAVNAPATTTTASRNPANPPASATPGRPPSCCTASTPAQHDQLTLRGIAYGPGSGAERHCEWAAIPRTMHGVRGPQPADPGCRLFLMFEGRPGMPDSGLPAAGRGRGSRAPRSGSDC